MELYISVHLAICDANRTNYRRLTFSCVSDVAGGDFASTFSQAQTSCMINILVIGCCSFFWQVIHFASNHMDDSKNIPDSGTFFSLVKDITQTYLLDKYCSLSSLTTGHFGRDFPPLDITTIRLMSNGGK